MIKRQMVYIDGFDSVFKDKEYNISRFVDIQTLFLYTGTNLKGDFEIGKTYNCVLEYKNRKLVVISAE